MSDKRIIFTGPEKAGKTTAIASISDAPPISSGALAGETTLSMDSRTTAAMDQGLMQLEGGEKVHLYGISDQELFGPYASILTEDSIGLILLLDDFRPNPLGDLQFFIDAFAGFIHRVQLAVGITKTDLGGQSRLGAYHDYLRRSGMMVPMFEIDARKRSDVIMLLEALFFALDPELEA